MDVFDAMADMMVAPHSEMRDVHRILFAGMLRRMNDLLTESAESPCEHLKSGAEAKASAIKTRHVGHGRAMTDKALRDLGAVTEEDGEAHAKASVLRAYITGFCTTQKDGRRGDKYIAPFDDVDALLLRGCISIYHRKDEKDARVHFIKAADKGCGIACYYVARCLFDDAPEILNVLGNPAIGPMHKRAVQYMTRAARKNVTDAQLDLGVMHTHHGPVKKDLKRAIKWLSRAAQAGEVRAMHNLFVLLKDKKPRAAFRWALKAATSGHPSSMKNVAICFDRGIGTDKDETQAKQWMGAHMQTQGNNSQEGHSDDNR